MVGIFQEMGVKPKMDSREDFENWMKSYMSTVGKGKDAPVHVITQLPQVSKFSGEVKGDQVSFDLWKYEVKSLKESDIHEPETVFQAVRKSLRGEASRVAMRLGPGAPLDELLDKLEGIYGTIESGEDILAKFYAASQQENENVVSWGFRLENILDKAIEQKLVTKIGAAEMLRSKFWTGLKRQLKDANRGHFESGMSYDELRVNARRVEQEHGVLDETANQVKSKQVSQSKMHAVDSARVVSTGRDKQMDELKEMMKSLSTRIDSLQEEVKGMKQNSSDGNYGAPARFPASSAASHDQYTRDYRFERQQRGRPRMNFGSVRQPYVQPATANTGFRAPTFIRPTLGYNGHRQSLPRQQQESSHMGATGSDAPVCYRCGQIGHLQYRCGVDLPLN